MSDDYLALKWGTIKEVHYPSEPVRLALERYHAAGPRSMSAALQEDSPAQKEALCDLIAAVAEVGGTIKDEWTGKLMTADEAERYVLGDDARAQSLAGKVIVRNVMRSLLEKGSEEDE